MGRELLIAGMRCLSEAETVLAEQVEELVDEMHEVKRQLLSRQ